jgi:hypothetical protein
LLRSSLDACDFNVRNLCLAATSYTGTGNFKFPYGPIKLSTHGSGNINEEFGSGKEGKLVKLALNLTRAPLEALCGPSCSVHTANVPTGLQTQAESLNSLSIRTCSSDSKIFFLKLWFSAGKCCPSETASLLWAASSYVVRLSRCEYNDKCFGLNSVLDFKAGGRVGYFTMLHQMLMLCAVG